ncbi:MAG: aspartate kinase [Pseudomonadota bacterium]
MSEQSPMRGCRRILQKFGGTSLGSLELIRAAAQRVAAAHRTGDQVAVVCSAMGGETDRLLGMARAMAAQADRAEVDVLLASGEQVSIALMAIALRELGLEARSWLGFQVPVITEATAGKARIRQIETGGLIEDLQRRVIPVVAGFQGVDEHGRVTTLGRGGSDTSAVALAVALDADECQILSDVDGVYTTDPRAVDDAQLIRRLSFEEMLELAGQGSKVLQTRSVEFASKHGMAVRVMHSTGNDSGTLIAEEEDGALEAPLVSGIAFSRDEAEITVTRVPNLPGTAYKILSPVSEANIEVDMIVMASHPDGGVDVTFTVHRNEFVQAIKCVESALVELPGSEVRGNSNVVKIAAVGIGMRSHAGIASRMFEALAAERINVRMVSTSEIKMAVLVDEEYLELGVKALHRAFRLHEPPATD